MGKRTEFSVLALSHIFEIRGAKFSLVFVRMVKLFDSIVSLIAVVTVGALLMIFDVPALLRLIKPERSSPIFLIIVVVRALFHIMALRVSRAGAHLKEIQIKEWDALSHLHVLGTVIAILLFLLVYQLGLEIGDDSSGLLKS